MSKLYDTYAVAALLVALTACASAPLVPTAEHPVVACAISCPDGWWSIPSKTCKNAKTWYQTIVVRGEYVTRGADGAILTDLWITDQGDYPRDVVVLMSCDSYRIEKCMSLSVTDHPCAAHPGEPDPNSAGSLTPPQ